MKKLTKKKCEDCGQMKPLDEFYYWAGGVLDYHCMKCHDTKFDNHKRKSRKKVKRMKITKQGRREEVKKAPAFQLFGD